MMCDLAKASPKLRVMYSSIVKPLHEERMGAGDCTHLSHAIYVAVVLDRAVSARLTDSSANVDW